MIQITDNLVLWYKCDENSGASQIVDNAASESSNFDGLVNAFTSTLSTTDAQIEDRAFFFNSLYFIDIDLELSLTNFTISFWHKESSIAGNDYIFAATSNLSKIFFTDSGGDNMFIFIDDYFQVYNYSDFHGESNAWHHILITRSSNGSAKAYADNSFINNTGNSGSPFGKEMKIENIGARAIAADMYSGRLDNIQIWDKVLSSTERSYVYNNGVAGRSPESNIPLAVNHYNRNR